MKSLDQKEKFIQLRANNISFDKIAKELNISKPTLIKWSHEFEIDIYNRRQLLLEGLREKYELSELTKMESLVILYKKVLAELQGRDFSDISSDNLLKMLFSIEDKIKHLSEITLREKELDIAPELYSVSKWSI